MITGPSVIAMLSSCACHYNERSEEAILFTLNVF